MAESIRFRVTLRNTVLDTFRSRSGWTESSPEADDWDITFTDVGWVHDHLGVHGAPSDLEPHQRVNHFPNHYELTRKDLMVKNIKRMKRQLQRTQAPGSREAARFDIYPASFVLPADYGIFAEEFKRCGGSDTVWIMKPVGSAQGKGIFLFTKLSEIRQWRKSSHPDADREQRVGTYIVQRYIASPHLVGGKKYDMRIYTLVTSFSPLVVWLYRTGFCRFSVTKYSTDPEDISNPEMHLTNNAIQKKSDAYGQDGLGDCKWDCAALKLCVRSFVWLGSFPACVSLSVAQACLLLAPTFSPLPAIPVSPFLSRSPLLSSLIYSCHVQLHGRAPPGPNGGSGSSISRRPKRHHSLPPCGPKRHHPGPPMLRTLRL